MKALSFPNGGNACSSYCFHLSEHGFRFYASLSPVFQTFPGAEQPFGFCLYLLSLWFSSIVLSPFALKHRHLSGQPSHLTALYLAFSLTYPDAVSRVWSLSSASLSHGADAEVMPFIVVEVFCLERVRIESRPLFHVKAVVFDVGLHAIFFHEAVILLRAVP